MLSVGIVINRYPVNYMENIMTSKGISQEHIRLTPALKEEFNRLIDAGNYNKSAVLRSIIASWVEAEQQSQAGDVHHD